MKRSKLLASRLREVLIDGRWIANTNIKEQIENLTWKQATQKIGEHNSIAALTFHINYYLGGVLNVFKGGTLNISDKYSFDMPPIESEKNWQQLITDYLSNANEFVQQVELMEDKKLDEVFEKEIYGSYERNIEGLIEHSYYHLGQMSLINKLILNSPMN